MGGRRKRRPEISRTLLWRRPWPFPGSRRQRNGAVRTAFGTTVRGLRFGESVLSAPRLPSSGLSSEDVRSARKELESRRVEFVTDVEGNESEAWTYFRGPDGYLYELWQTMRPLNAVPPK